MATRPASGGSQPPGPFRDWLKAQLELRGIVGVGEAGRALGISQSMMSRYLAGQDRPSRKNVIAIAHGLRLPVDEVQAVVHADQERIGSATGRTDPLVTDQLEEIRRVMGELAERFAANPPPVAYGPLPFTRMLEAAAPFPGAGGGRMTPYVVRRPHPLAVGAGGDRAVAWVLDATTPQPGWWVRVSEVDADPPTLKPYAPGDAVTGVVAILQVVPRA